MIDFKIRNLPIWMVMLFVSLSLAGPGTYVQQPGPEGLICIEAERFSSNDPGEEHAWQLNTDISGYSGSGAMQALPDMGLEEDIDYGDSPSMDYQVYFARPGTYYVWIRGWGIDDGASAHLDLDHRELFTAEEIEFEPNQWDWGSRNGDKRTFLKVQTPGLHTVSLCMRHDGMTVDKILLTPRQDFVPQGIGRDATVDGGIFHFPVAERMDREGTVETVRIPVMLDGVPKGAYTVDYSVIGGSADSKDYQVDEGTLEFAPGETQKEIVLDIVDDSLDEPDETVIVSLSNPKGRNAQIGAADSFVYTILDPRPTVEFATGLSGTDEKEGKVNIPLRLSFAYHLPVTVECNAAGGTAASEDYSIPANRVRFEPGDTTALLTVMVNADDMDEPSESIELQLVQAQNARLDGRNKHLTGIVTPSYHQLGDAVYFRYNSNERWERYAKVGDHADALVEIGKEDDRIIFWRGSSYLPFIETASRQSYQTDLQAEQRGLKSFVPDHTVVRTHTKHSYLDRAVPVNGDAPGKRFDTINRYSHVRIVERSPARAVVQWRYIPDFANPRPQGWTEEYFTIYPDGRCFRFVKTGTDNRQAYTDSSHGFTREYVFTDQGVFGMPGSWIQPHALAADEKTRKHFNVAGFNPEDGSYCLEVKQPGKPENAGLKSVWDVKNPVIVIKNWGDADVNIKIDGSLIHNYKTGYAEKMNNNDLVIWLDHHVHKDSRIEIYPAGAAEPVVRSAVPDPYASEIPVLPEGSADPGPFGAYYTTLKYWELWDEPWRVGDYADVVVQFQQSADRLVFWRGTSYVPHWVNEKNFWYENEFCERRGEDSGLKGLCEPMNEHECRYSHVKIIHSSDARSVVHWRYVPCTLKYEHPFTDETGWGDYVDEYYYIYPDETCVRDVKLQTSVPNVFHEFQEVIPLVNPGMIPEDILEMNALSLANVSGEVQRHNFKDGFPTNDAFKDGLNIVLVGMKGKSKPFAIAESYGQWHDPISRPDDTRFNHYDDWPAWPEKYRREDWDKDPDNNYREFWKFLPSHSSLMHLDWDNYASDLDGPVIYLRKILLNGMTESSDVTSLIPLTRFWESAPLVKVSGYGFSDAVFEKSQKAYHLKRRISWIDSLVNRDDDKMVNQKADRVDLDVLATEKSPLINPCFVIENWPADKRAVLTINGQKMTAGKDYHQGIERHYETWETQTDLVLWIRHTSERNVRFSIQMQD